MATVDETRARYLLQVFYSAANISNMTFDEFLAYMNNLNPDFMQAFAKNITIVENNGIDTVSAMQKLAAQTGGKLPQNSRGIQVFMYAIDDPLTDPDLLQWIESTAIQTAKGLKDTAVTVVDSVVGFAKYAIPLGIAAALFIAYNVYIKPSKRALRSNPRKWKKGSRIQSLLIEKKKFDKKHAKSWAKSHGFKATKIHTTKSYHRIRQEPPSHFKSFRMGHKIAKGVKPLYGEVK